MKNQCDPCPQSKTQASRKHRCFSGFPVLREGQYMRWLGVLSPRSRTGLIDVHARSCSSDPFHHCPANPFLQAASYSLRRKWPRTLPMKTHKHSKRKTQLSLLETRRRTMPCIARFEEVPLGRAMALEGGLNQERANVSSSLSQQPSLEQLCRDTARASLRATAGAQRH